MCVVGVGEGGGRKGVLKMDEGRNVYILINEKEIVRKKIGEDDQREV